MCSIQNAPVHDDSATSDQLPNYPYIPLPKKVVEYLYVAQGDKDENFVSILTRI